MFIIIWAEWYICYQIRRCVSGIRLYCMETCICMYVYVCIEQIGTSNIYLSISGIHVYLQFININTVRLLIWFTMSELEGVVV